MATETTEPLYRVVDAAYQRRSIAPSSNLHPAGVDELMPKTPGRRWAVLLATLGSPTAATGQDQLAIDWPAACGLPKIGTSLRQGTAIGMPHGGV